MATGGVTCEEELYSFELYECSVCLGSLINKQPRLLSCGHTFCTPCLQKLPRGNTVYCPKCRSPTRLPPAGVQALPKNIDISKMREREQELSARNEHFCQMCRKRDAKIEYICTSCPKRLICKACYHKHQRIPALMAHNVLPIEETLPVEQTHENCKKHGELLEYFCPQCEETICVMCTCDLQHEEHCDQIVDFKTSLKELKASMNKICQEFKQNSKRVEICAEMLKQDTDTIEDCKDALSAKCQEVETILNQMKEQLKVIIQIYEPLRNSQQEINKHFTDVQKQMMEINNLQQGSDIDFIRKIKECRRNCDRVMNNTQMILNRKITIPENIKQNIKIVGSVEQVKTIKLSLKEKLLAKTQPEVAKREKPQIKPDIQQELRPSQRQTDKYNELNHLELLQAKTIQVSLKEKLLVRSEPAVLTEKEQIKPETKQTLRPSQRKTDKSNELNNLELLSEIKPGETVDMRDPLEVVSVGDGTVILVDKELKYLQRINTEGEVVRRYQVPLIQYSNYKTACVYGDCLFVATSDNVITKMSLDGSDSSMKYRPEGVKEIDHMSVVGDNVILISEVEWSHCGRILQYHRGTNQIMERVTGIAYPGKVSVVQDGQHTKYIVKCSKSAWLYSGRQVNIYNRTWNLISTIDINTHLLTVTPGGKLLLVNYNKIQEYNQDGTFIKGLLDKYRFKNIRDITCDGGYVCVFQSDPYSIKIFISN